MHRRLLIAGLAGAQVACLALGNEALLQIHPAHLATPRTAQQRLQFTRGNSSHSLELVLELDATRLSVIGAALGVRLFTLDYSGHEVRVGSGRGLPPGLEARRVINDLLMILSPLAPLRAALEQDWQVQQTAGQRALLHHARLEIAITSDASDPWQGRSTLQHLRHGYQLLLDSALA